MSTGLVTQVLLTATGLWLTPFLLSRLGGATYGLWLLATQLLAYLSLLDLGVIALVPREVAHAWGTRESDASCPEVRRVLGSALRVIALQVPVIALAALLLWFFLPTQWADMRNALGVALAGFVVLYPFRAASATLEGLQELPFVGRTFMVAWLLGTLTTIVLVLTGAGLMAVALGWIVQQGLASAAWTHRLWTRYRALLPRGLEGDRGDAISHLKRGSWVSLSQVATVFLYGTDLLIIGKVLGPAAVVPYSMTLKLIQVLQNQPQALMHAALPGIAEMRGRGDRVGVLRVVNGLALGMLLLSGLVATVVLTINRSFIAWWVGPSLFGGQAMTLLMVLVMLMRHWGLVMTQANFALGDNRRLGIVSLVEGTTTVVATYALVYLLGPLGAVVGALAGATLIRVPMQLTELARRTGKSWRELVGTLAPFAWRLAIMLAIAFLISPVLPRVEPSVHGRDVRVFLVIGGAAALVGIAYVLLMAGVVPGSALESYATRARAAIALRWVRLRTREARD